MRFISTEPLELPKPMPLREPKEGETESAADLPGVLKVLLD